MPAFDLPGLITPGQFGPMIWVALPFDFAYAQNSAESCTGMPSVITMTSGIAASTASMTAALANAGGTKTTDTFAPVSAIASATVPKIGSACSVDLDGGARLARVGAADDVGAAAQHVPGVLRALASRSGPGR